MLLPRSWILRSLCLLCASIFSAVFLWLVMGDRPFIAAQGLTYTVGVAPCGTTIQACIDQAYSGDTILISAGTYTESLTLNKAVNLTGAGRASTVIRAATNQRVLTISGLVVSNTVVSGLTLTGGRLLTNSGGGVAVLSMAEPTLDDVAITYNFTAYGGGGLLNSSIMTLTNSIVAFNVAQGPGGGGGILTGCYADCRIFIRDTTISNNIITALPSYGAGIHNRSYAELTNVTIHTNNGRQGAGIANYEITSVMTVTNATIVNNGFSALPFSDYSGILNFGSITVANSTISNNGNSEVTVTGGIWNASSSGSFVLRNTIVANNVGGNCASATTPFVDDGGNLQFGPASGCLSSVGELPSGDPGLNPLANNGGPTQTMALSAGSAAIDAGLPAYCPATDQRGSIRSTPCDSGSFEYIAPSYSIFLPLLSN